MSSFSIQVHFCFSSLVPPCSQWTQRPQTTVCVHQFFNLRLHPKMVSIFDHFDPSQNIVYVWWRVPRSFCASNLSGSAVTAFRDLMHCSTLTVSALGFVFQQAKAESVADCLCQHSKRQKCSYGPVDCSLRYQGVHFFSQAAVVELSSRKSADIEPVHVSCRLSWFSSNSDGKSPHRGHSFIVLTCCFSAFEFDFPYRNTEDRQAPIDPQHQIKLKCTSIYISLSVEWLRQMRQLLNRKFCLHWFLVFLMLSVMVKVQVIIYRKCKKLCTKHQNVLGLRRPRPTPFRDYVAISQSRQFFHHSDVRRMWH